MVTCNIPKVKKYVIIKKFLNRNCAKTLGFYKGKHSGTFGQAGAFGFRK